jgi:membrane protease YdiL (CAAX protease family)
MPQIENKTFDPGSSGILAPGRLFRTRALLWGALLFAIVLGFFFASVFGAGWIGLRGNWLYLPPIALPLLACWIYAILVRQFERRTPWELQIGPRLLSDLPFGFLLGGVFITGMWLVLWIFGLYFTHRGVWSRWFNDLVFDSYISAVLEELAFRAVILRILARVWGVRTGVILSSIIFGLAHFTHGSWLGIFGIIINAGIAMGLLYVITGRLWMSIGMHLGYDFIETSVLGIGSHHGFLVNVPKPGAAAWLTGGTFGPDAAVPAMILGVMINAALWHYAFGKRVTSAPKSEP